MLDHHRPSRPLVLNDDLLTDRHRLCLVALEVVDVGRRRKRQLLGRGQDQRVIYPLHSPRVGNQVRSAARRGLLELVRDPQAPRRVPAVEPVGGQVVVRVGDRERPDAGMLLLGRIAEPPRFADLVRHWLGENSSLRVILAPTAVAGLKAP